MTRGSGADWQREVFATLFQQFPEPMFAYEFRDDGPAIVAVNEAFEETFGFDAETAVGAAVDDLIVPPEEIDEAKDLDERVRTGERIDTEVRRQTVDGEQYFRFRTVAIEGENGPDGFAVYADIGERKDRERRLKEQKATVETLHDVAAEIEAAGTADDVFELVVEAAEDILDFDIAIADAVEDGALVPKAISSGLSDRDYYERVPVDAEDNFAARAYRNGESILVDDLREYDVSPADATFRSIITVPIGSYGVFQAGAEAISAFDETDLELTELLVTHAREALARLDRERSLRERTRELERQNDRLDDFAKIVSHDLRNPLNLAQGRLDAAREERDDPHLAKVAEGLDRIETIVENTLTLARQGQTVGETESVRLADIAKRCWGTLDLEGATLEIEGDVAFEADTDRLRHVFENLFRNAVEHADDGVTIHVGALDDEAGFYVEDDGPGIPEEEREAVFETGYTTAEEGTGFGLAIVEEVVAAHGWEIAVTEGSAGGARFEISGIEVYE